MKNQFKMLLLILITSAVTYGQRHQILKESITVDKNTSIVLNFENIYVALEESTDGKIHFDYKLEFEGYSKKQIKSTLDGLKAEVTNANNIVNLDAKSLSQITFQSFTLVSEHGLYIDDDFIGSKNDTVIRKSKDSLLQQIRKNNRSLWSKNSLQYINGRFKKMDKDGNLSDIRKGDVDIMRSVFVIKVPPFVSLNINAKNSGIHVRNDLQNELSFAIKKGTLKTKALFNTYNVVRINDANFEAEGLYGGTYNLKNATNCKIGNVEMVKIDSEFSKIEIGEIGENTIITDFNSEYWFYNWSNSFDRFSFYSEYSKAHLFYPKKNHSLKVVGHNTKTFIGEDMFEINMQPQSKGEKYIMMKKEPHPGENLTGNIFFDIIHGIIYIHSDQIAKINN